jgi:hypothetical protein
VPEQLLALKLSKTRDPDGVSLRGVLELHVEIERARRGRQVLVYVLGGLGVPVWLSAALPDVLPKTARSFSLAAWAVCFLCAGSVLISEWRLRKKQALLIEKVGLSAQIPTL